MKLILVLGTSLSATGLAAGFAAVSGGYAGNLFPGASDALILGITEPAARLIDPSYSVNVAGNWFFIVGVVFVFTPIVWFLTDRVIEPRLGPWTPIAGVAPPKASEKEPLTADEKRGLTFAGGSPVKYVYVPAHRAVTAKFVGYIKEIENLHNALRSWSAPRGYEVTDRPYESWKGGVDQAFTIDGTYDVYWAIKQ